MWVEPSGLFKTSSLSCLITCFGKKKKTVCYSLFGSLLVGKELQVKSDPHLSRWNFVQQQTACHRSLVLQLFLYGCYGNLCPPKKHWCEKNRKGHMLECIGRQSKGEIINNAGITLTWWIHVGLREYLLWWAATISFAWCKNKCWSTKVYSNFFMVYVTSFNS